MKKLKMKKFFKNSHENMLFYGILDSVCHLGGRENFAIGALFLKRLDPLREGGGLGTSG